MEFSDGKTLLILISWPGLHVYFASEKHGDCHKSFCTQSPYLWSGVIYIKVVMKCWAIHFCLLWLIKFYSWLKKTFRYHHLCEAWTLKKNSQLWFCCIYNLVFLERRFHLFLWILSCSAGYVFTIIKFNFSIDGTYKNFRHIHDNITKL